MTLSALPPAQSKDSTAWAQLAPPLSVSIGAVALLVEQAAAAAVVEKGSFFNVSLRTKGNFVSPL